MGARLMAALKVERGGDVAFAGVGGPEMEAEGLVSLFPMGDLSIMGLFEVLPGLRKVLMRLKQTVSAVQSLKPDLVITVDAQAFSYRVAKRLAPASCPVIHYVAPTVWAWKPWRARKVAQVVDRLLLLLPFEKALSGMRSTRTAPSSVTPLRRVPVGDARDMARDVSGRTCRAPACPVAGQPQGARWPVTSRCFRATLERLSLGSLPAWRLVVPTVANVADVVRSERGELALARHRR